jgi:hypothetical protein
MSGSTFVICPSLLCITTRHPAPQNWQIAGFDIISDILTSLIGDTYFFPYSTGQEECKWLSFEMKLPILVDS